MSGLSSRDTRKDVGRKSYTKSEAKRETLLDVFSANMKRIQEALRVLEEFSKLIHNKSSREFKKTRFRIYELEKRIFYLLVRKLKLDFDLYLVMDPMRDHIKTAKAAIAGGAKIIQLRDKTASKKQILKWAKQIRKLTKKAGVTFILNDYPDIAREVDADGIHLGQGDLKVSSIKAVRKKLGLGKIIGVSTHSFAQAVHAERAGADYIAVGPIFKTPTKPDVAAVGLKLLSRVLSRIKVPVVAIGGINSSTIYSVKKAGCLRVAVIRAVLAKRNIKNAVIELRKKLGC